MIKNITSSLTSNLYSVIVKLYEQILVQQLITK